VAWFESAMIETSIIKTFGDQYRYIDINSKDDILNTFEDALKSFSIKDLIGFDDNDDPHFSVEETIRVWVRPQGAEAPKEITEELFLRLKKIQGYE